MRILEQIQAEITEAKRKLKIVNATQIVIDAFLNKDRYIHKGYGTTSKVFSGRENKLFYFGGLTVSVHDIEHYNEMYKISFKENPPYTKKLKAALKLIEKNDDLLFSVVYPIIEEQEIQ